ncbi:hypothetical protein D3C76_1805960 [compost metagenome]
MTRVVLDGLYIRNNFLSSFNNPVPREKDILLSDQQQRWRRIIYQLFTFRKLRVILLHADVFEDFPHDVFIHFLHAVA